MDKNLTNTTSLDGGFQSQFIFCEIPMHRILVILTCLLLFSSVHAAEKTLLMGHLTHGGYGAPVVKFTTMDGSSSVLAGCQGEWIINHTFGLGIGGYGLVTELDYNRPNQHNAPGFRSTEHRRLEMSYGGVLLSYIMHSDQMMHPSFDLLIAGGSLNMNSREWDDSDEYDSRLYDENRDSFFVLEPVVNAELNVVRFMRLNAGLGYRWVSGVSRFGYSNADIGGVSGTLTLKFGKF
jgi:hypothetical protein